jgi:hypothetical protein
MRENQRIHLEEKRVSYKKFGIHGEVYLWGTVVEWGIRSKVNAIPL